MKQKFNQYIWLVGVIFALLASGCGASGGGATGGSVAGGGGAGGGGGTGGGGTAAVTTGSAMFGVWRGATINVYAMTATGGAGAKVAGPMQTGTLGIWTPVMPKGAGPWLVQATGGNYTDEATGATVSMAGKQVEAVMVAGLSHITLSPLSQALTDRVRFLIAQGFTPLQSVALAHDQFVAVFGIDPVNDDSIMPSRMLTVSDQDRTIIYAAILGGLSSLVQNPAMTTLGGANNGDVQLALARDMADFKLDGLDVNGRQVTVTTPAGQVALPALDATGLNALNSAAQNYANGKTGSFFTRWHINSFGWFAGLPVAKFGQLSLSDTAVGVIGSNLVVPQKVTVGAGDPSWDSETVISAPINVTIVTGFVNMVYVSYQPYGSIGASYAWSRNDFTGVTINQTNRTVTFNNAMLPAQAGILLGNNTQLVLNGILKY